MPPLLPVIFKLLLLPLFLWLWFDTSALNVSLYRWPALDFGRASSSGSRPAFSSSSSSPAAETVDPFNHRDRSDRFVKGTRPTLIKNATIFTGTADRLIVQGDIFVDKGIIQDFGDSLELNLLPPETSFVNARGAWLTPGLIDLSSQLGISAIPRIQVGADANSHKGPVVPWLRVIDAVSPQDEGFRLALASGVTTVKVNPGDQNVIGGQPAMIKTRRTHEGTPTSMQVDPQSEPWGLHHGCGDDLATYGMTKMDAVWALRSAYHDAQEQGAKLEELCEDAAMEHCPDVSLIGNDMRTHVMRGKAKISVHCDQVVDLDAWAQVSREFELPVTILHGAREVWLSTGLLNQTWHGPPVVALSVEHNSGKEEYRDSQFAARILSDANITIAIESGYPNLTPRTLAQGARQAYYYGLSENETLAAVTSVPAIAAGIAHRTGYIREGFDADLVLWDSHPLALGAKPRMVWVDGALQLNVSRQENSRTHHTKNLRAPSTPNWDYERASAIAHAGQQPLKPRFSTNDEVVFRNVSRVWIRDDDGELRRVFEAKDPRSNGIAVFSQGRLLCADMFCLNAGVGDTEVDLRGGVIMPGLLAYGQNIGMSRISNPLSTNLELELLLPVSDDNGGMPRAMDGLSLQTRKALEAYRSGITSAVLHLLPRRFHGLEVFGLSVAFRPGALHAMERGAIIQDITALHIKLSTIGITSQLAVLRRLLYGEIERDTDEGQWFKHASEGIIPLVVDVDSADIMALLLILKANVEDRIGSSMRLVFVGASEAHLLATEIGRANVGVILEEPHPLPLNWDSRRTLPPGKDDIIGVLQKHGVRVGSGSGSRFVLAEMVAEGIMDETQAFTVAGANLEALLGIRERNLDVVAYFGGGAFNLSGKAIAVASVQRAVVDIL
ncbi:composite domain of metallo-dependent hydrolase [Cylindrobasidium torrendii FP15055 ss-10]|uniref:Composite domain of metallo-dependent hydrolase n=1 Tax=Cylindrobasidium torrendii FP15055 ss-10 TaxID=1314674 RepID=A0A0D7BED3_9AGAR|nr:composite domain of metallo-dependent hydrolase [Cylindrobasidium torrendii FP15055 ss-10]